MIPPKKSLVKFNERALCLFMCSVHVKHHTGLLHGLRNDTLDQNLRASSKQLAQGHLQNQIANCRMNYA